MRRVNAMFTDAEHEGLRSAKGDRTWREAILEEFGVEEQ